MRLALLAPIGRSIPPRYDGPRERQIALLCAGHTAGGRCHVVCQRGFHGSRPAGCRMPGSLCCRLSLDAQTWESLHIAHLSARAGEFDLIHNHGDTLPLAYSRPLPTPVVTTLYSRPAPQVLPLLQHHVDRSYYIALSLGSSS